MIGIALLLGVPLAILVALYLVSPQRWRKASVPADALPFRNRVFSALKRAALAWVWGMLALLLASAALAELPFPVPFSILGWSVPVAVVLAALWGMLRPRIYEDRVDRARNGARIGWVLLVICLPFVYLPACLFSSALARNGFGGLGLRRDEKPKAYHITAERYSAAKFAFASPVSEKMIPEDATDIIFDFRFGLFGGTMSLGAGAELKCKVSREGLEKFAKDNKYKFRSDSYKKNECADGPQTDCDWIWTTFDKYNPPHKSTRCQSAERMPDGTIRWEPILEPAERPKKFLAYNYRYSNCGGYSFFYDVDGQVLYANWSSN